MKKQIQRMALLAICSLFFYAGNAQVKIGDNPTTIDSSSMLEVASTTQGFLPPRMTSGQRDSIASALPAVGLTIYNTDNKCLEFFNGTEWISFCDGSVVTTPGTIPGNEACGIAPISATPCSSVSGATLNDNAATADGIEYDWTGAATSGMANTSTTRALVDIGGQCWMRYNMDTIPSNFNPPPTWSNFVDNGFSGYYTGGSFTNEGRLYQWSAAMNGSTTERAQGICPTGWHVPSRCEYMYLDNSLGMSIADQQAFSFNRNSGSVGNKLKATTGTNSSGFSALFTGWRSSGGSYQNRGTRSYFWMSTERSAANARYIQLRNNEVGVGSFSNFKSMAMPVRCLKD